MVSVIKLCVCDKMNANEAAAVAALSASILQQPTMSLWMNKFIVCLCGIRKPLLQNRKPIILSALMDIEFFVVVVVVHLRLGSVLHWSCYAYCCCCCRVYCLVGIYAMPYVYGLVTVWIDFYRGMLSCHRTRPTFCATFCRARIEY